MTTLFGFIIISNSRTCIFADMLLVPLNSCESRGYCDAKATESLSSFNATEGKDPKAALAVFMDFVIARPSEVPLRSDTTNSNVSASSSNAERSVEAGLLEDAADDAPTA